MNIHKLEELDLDIRLLRGSVKKWSLISVGLGGDGMSSNCPLCQRYGEPKVEDGEPDEECFNCPVSEHSGCQACFHTPWFDWNMHISKHLREIDDRHWIRDEELRVCKCGECRTLANKELMYIQKILENHLTQRKELISGK